MEICYIMKMEIFWKHKIFPKCPYYSGIYPRLDEDDEENNKFLKEWYEEGEWKCINYLFR